MLLTSTATRTSRVLALAFGKKTCWSHTTHLPPVILSACLTTAATRIFRGPPVCSSSSTATIADRPLGSPLIGIPLSIALAVPLAAALGITQLTV
eukprot:89769-Pelagomonas_calceolata.AAC.1